jgi:STE24 endopeptidase
MDEKIIDVESQKKAKQYSRLQRRLMVIEIVFSLIFILAWLIFGWSKELKAILNEYTNNEWLLVAIFGMLFGGFYYLLSLPLSYYEGFIIPHRFDLSTQTMNGWILDQGKILIIGGILGGLMLEIVYAFLRLFPDWWWLGAGIILLIFNVILANLTPLIIFPIFYKFVPLENEFKELSKRLIKLADQAGAHVQGVFKFDMSRRTKLANAGLTGLGNTRRIILGDTLLNEFSEEEIETVLAHELGHHVHNDIPLEMIVGSAITMIGLYLSGLGLKAATAFWGYNGPGDIASLPLFLLVIGFYGLVTMPLGNAFSRWRERLADEYALQLTGNNSAYVSALIRLANQNLAEIDPAPWEEFLLHSHPALGKRIALAKTWTGRKNNQ